MPGLRRCVTGGSGSQLTRAARSSFFSRTGMCRLRSRAGGAGLHLDRHDAAAGLQHMVDLGVAVSGLADPGERRRFPMEGPAGVPLLTDELFGELPFR